MASLTTTLWASLKTIIRNYFCFKLEMTWGRRHSRVQTLTLVSLRPCNGWSILISKLPHLEPLKKFSTAKKRSNLPWRLRDREPWQRSGEEFRYWAEDQGLESQGWRASSSRMVRRSENTHEALRLYLKIKLLLGYQLLTTCRTTQFNHQEEFGRQWWCRGSALSNGSEGPGFTSRHIFFSVVFTEHFLLQFFAIPSCLFPLLLSLSFI